MPALEYRGVRFTEDAVANVAAGFHGVVLRHLENRGFQQ